ncbi:MAG: membrane-associated protein [Candidatus Azotimanducaceae bacterium]
MILNWLRDNQEYALIIVPVIAFLEAFVGIGIFVSGIILLSVCTLMYTEQIATLPQMLPLAILGATIADHSGYYLGLWLGPRFHHTAFASKRRKFIDRSENMIRRFGGYAIIFGRLMTAIRSLVPLLVGVSGMPRWKYTLLDLTACAIWTTGLGLLVVGLDNLIS